jgi:signal peptidase II
VKASAARGRPDALLFGVAGVTVAFDQLVKVAARRGLDVGASVPLVGDWVRLTLVHNTGSAFGLISSEWVLIAVGVAVCVAVLAYAIVGRGAKAAPERALPMGLVLGGSLGNVLDRIRAGGVTDFIDLRVWPVFNLADIAITVGIGLLVIGLTRRH